MDPPSDSLKSPAGRPVSSAALSAACDVDARAQMRADLHWSAAGHAGKISIVPGAGVCLISDRRDGRHLAALLADALDRAARAPGDPVMISRGRVEVLVSVPPKWPRTRSWLAAHCGAADAPKDDALSPEDAEWLRTYPTRRRASGARRRRLELSLAQIDDRVRTRRRRAKLSVAAVASGLVLAAAGAILPHGLVFLIGACLFSSAAAAFSVFRLSARRHVGHRERLERWIAESSRDGVEVEETAQRLSRLRGDADPWTSSSRLEREAMLEEGWPSDVVRMFETEDARAMKRRIDRFARRIETLIPEPWPVLVWEPWRGPDASVRAELLHYLSQEIHPRPVIAVIGAPVREGSSFASSRD